MKSLTFCYDNYEKKLLEFKTLNLNKVYDEVLFNSKKSKYSQLK